MALSKLTTENWCALARGVGRFAGLSIVASPVLASTASDKDATLMPSTGEPSGRLHARMDLVSTMNIEPAAPVDIANDVFSTK